MNVTNVFDAKDKQAIFTLSATVGTDLTIRIIERKRFNALATNIGFPFQAVVAGVFQGNNLGYQDTDSAQVAVRWINPTTADLGHATNAASTAEGKRTKGADWDFTGMPGSRNKPGTEVGYWTTGKPAGATHFDAVIVYTDVLYNTPASAEAG